MSTSKDNVQKMIAAFIAYDKNAKRNTQDADDLLQILLDNSKLPLTQNDSARNDAEKDEIAEMNNLMNGRDADSLWNTPEDLRALIVTYPPVIMERLLIAAIAIRILRHDNVDMDSETDAFNEFYAGWCAVVLAA